MQKYDTLIQGGTIIDGSGAQRFIGDIGIQASKIAKIGTIDPSEAKDVVDARGLIVAPGVIDLHTHYDGQIHWDPYCTASGWHGTTTVVVANCGFGFAPCKPADRERYMGMMENTEQYPPATMRLGMKWNWTTFPEWMECLKKLPKGINVANYLPVNPLLSYVIGADEAKTRSATPEERRRMRELLHEAMDAGASGFSLTIMGAEGNSHIDADHTAMPSDVMDPEDLYNLCDVLRERNEGVIQIACEMGPNIKREIAEEAARRSGRPILHFLTVAVDGAPDIHKGTLRWLDSVVERGLKIYSQGFTYRMWQEFCAADFTTWDVVPVFRTFSQAGSIAARVALARDPAFRERLRKEFDPIEYYAGTGGNLANYILHSAKESKTFERFVGEKLENIATALGRPWTDTLLDILIETELAAEFRSMDVGGTNPEYTAEIMRHDRILAGVSDGGAHMKMVCGGQWSTEMIIWLSRETGCATLEEIHKALSGTPAKAFGFNDRGLLKEGLAADLYIYDYDKLQYDYGHYTIMHDLPGGDWRRTVPAKGIGYTMVNGEITFIDGVCTQRLPGRLIANERGTGRASGTRTGQSTAAE